ncbi:MAG: Mini-ribonuclease 3 [Clostridium sp.]|nr:Mini-ribonuclease 3 [Clostridium sp.]
MNPLTLAFIGDGVFELYVRERVVLLNKDLKPNDLHKNAINYVKASRQSFIIEKLEDSLTEEEIYIYKRGRNMKSNTVPKNANMLDYRRSSGYEALVGYLYLIGSIKRLDEIIMMSLEIIENRKED